MNRAQLEHIIRAAAGNSDCHEIVVIGSQSILGKFPEAPAELLDSIEADVFPKDQPGKSILIDGAIGELSVFHQTFGYYAHGVDESTATLPVGWQERLIPITNENTRGNIGWCLEPHDLAVAKLAAGREKDLNYLRTLLRFGLVEPGVVQKRMEKVSWISNTTYSAAAARWQRLCSEVR